MVFVSALRTAVIHLCLVLVGLIVPFAVLEGGQRIEQYFRKGIPLSVSPRSYWDPVLGWRGTEHSLNTGDPAILVLGDSFTDGLGVPSTQMWFSRVAAAYGDVPLVAYGGMGYGTFQEILVLRTYLKSGVRPKLLILQMCSNDIINNYYPLEIGSIIQRPPGPRPYLEHGASVMRFPRAYGGVLLPVIGFSRFAYRMSTKWDARTVGLANAREMDSIEFHIDREGFQLAEFKEAVATTEVLLKMLKREAGDIPVVGMLVDDNEPFSSALKGAAKRAGIPLFIPVRRRPLTKDHRLSDGAHLNSAGNAIVGDALVELISERGLTFSSLERVATLGGAGRE